MVLPSLAFQFRIIREEGERVVELITQLLKAPNAEEVLLVGGNQVPNRRAAIKLVGGQTRVLDVCVAAFGVVFKVSEELGVGQVSDREGCET